MAVVNEANDKILLGRNVSFRRLIFVNSLVQFFSQKKWPGKFYSTLAGFIEPGEAFEDAVKRELWEEAGLKVWGVKYHSTQPWVRNYLNSPRDKANPSWQPFPANLMVGFYAIADDTQPTRTDLDNELEGMEYLCSRFPGL